MNKLNRYADRKLRPRVQLTIKGPGLTKQAPRDGTFITSILRKYANVGYDLNSVQVARSVVSRLTYGDSPGFDYQQQLNSVLKVQEFFAGLPSTVRDRFKNDPAVLIAALRDPANKAEFVKLGILEAEEQKEPPPPAAPAAPSPGK